VTDKEHETPAYGVAPPGYRLPDATRLGRVSLQVADLDRSTAFYEKILGLRVLDATSGRVCLGVDGAEADRPLVELRERRGVTPAPRGRRFGLYHFAVLLPDRASLGRFVLHLVGQGIRPDTADHFVSEALYFYDPDGLGIEVYADRPRTAWRSLDRELWMTTDPLDVQNLVAAAEGGRWDAAPAGTTMGHVHLHVGDLDVAGTFFHKGLGFDRMCWSIPGALFLSAGGYHHHLGLNTWAREAQRPAADEAQLVEWELIVPKATDAGAAARSLEYHDATTTKDGRDWIVRDPWGTALRLRGADVSTPVTDARPAGRFGWRR